MIIYAEIIDQPYSGEFKEIIYDIKSSWNSQDWTYIKFIEEDLSEWCGHFRGFPKNAAISNKYQIVLILTSDYLIQLDCKTAEIHCFDDQPIYQNIIITPNDAFLITDKMDIEKITNNIKQKKLIKSPIKMDLIEFKHWNNNLLEFTCDEFRNWDKHYLMEYNDEIETIQVKTNKPTK